jgi:lipopolysaccharide heptosyltransferase I
MRILIVKLGAIGDVVHTLPALAVLRRALPRGRIVWAAERGGAAELLRDNPCLDGLIELDLRLWRRSLTSRQTRAAIRGAIAQLREEKFDVALDFQGLLKSAAVAWLARAPRRVGFAAQALREPASAWLLTERVEVDDREHIIQKNLKLVEHLGCSTAGADEFPVGLSPEDERFAEEQIARRGGALAIINPGGGWVTKLWQPAGFAEIADRLWEAYGLPSVITYGPGEEALARSVASQAQSGAATALGSTLKQFFALARRAALFVGGDTGPLHLAAAAGAPIVGLYGPSSARRNGPVASDDVVVERRDLECRVDCYRRRCGHISCMKLPVEMVWQGVVKRLQIADCGLRNMEPILPVHHSSITIHSSSS